MRPLLIQTAFALSLALVAPLAGCSSSNFAVGIAAADSGPDGAACGDPPPLHCTCGGDVATCTNGSWSCPDPSTCADAGKDSGGRDTGTGPDTGSGDASACGDPPPLHCICQGDVPTCTNGSWSCPDPSTCADAATDSGGPDTAGGCAGQAPNCFGNDDSTCCGQDPEGQAQCTNGAWMCGTAAAPGCNGTSCIQPGCAGPTPECCSFNAMGCEVGTPATCSGSSWTCPGGVAPSGACSGICIADAGGGGPDASTGCTPACTASQVCVSVQIVGGAVHPDGGPSSQPPTYTCEPAPAACVNGTLNCACAVSACTEARPTSLCTSTSPGQVNCQLDAP